ncbi:hypothetical protein DdX_08298 [Ditylenchus destructor]|uniref:Uncharacterized protein n=1 Tax=Ditylenchus destructor TaxID=166010 RepID=A0AAD4N2V5_9BILA|nr:hypothetical protein DdX_08298 [Ditylenchus destructor]
MLSQSVLTPMFQRSRNAMLVPWPVLSCLSSRNGSKTGFLHSHEAASPRDNLFPRSRISRFSMVSSCNAQGSQWSMAPNVKSRSRMIPQQVLSSYEHKPSRAMQINAPS